MMPTSYQETVTALRAALAAAFPELAISVRKRGGTNEVVVDVRWCDGPSLHAVEAVAASHQGTGHGIGRIACERRYSVELLAEAAQMVVDAYGVSPFTIHDAPTGAWVGTDWHIWIGKRIAAMVVLDIAALLPAKGWEERGGNQCARSQ